MVRGRGGGGREAGGRKRKGQRERERVREETVGERKKKERAGLKGRERKVAEREREERDSRRPIVCTVKLRISWLCQVDVCSDVFVLLVLIYLPINFTSSL